jgi:hypothetical protein
MLSSLVWSTILDAESRRNAAFISDWEQPRRVSPGDARTFDNDSPQRAGPLIDEVGDLSNVRWRDSALRDDTMRRWKLPTGRR